MNVQHWADDEESPSDRQTYESIRCLACAGLHLINKKMGKLLGQEQK
jgi:hypothetical protein